MNNKQAGMKCRAFDALLLLFFSMATVAAMAARHVTVATIGTIPPSQKSSNQQERVDQVIKFWGAELKQVMPYKPDLIVLTETCDYPQGLTHEEKIKYFGVRKNQVMDYFASVAKSNHTYIVFGMERLAEDGAWRNSSVLLDRQGKIAGIYNKNFPTVTEVADGIKAGDEVPLFECDFGKVASVICFDLNFDELRQKFVRARPDILLFSSMYHGGDALQSFWAYSCRAFFVGSVAGRENPSEIRNPLGEVIASSTNYFDFTVSRINLDYKLAHLDENWGKLTALKEKYGAAVTVTDPGKLGAVLITSEHATVSAEDMVKEFGIELLDDYFNRSRRSSKQSLEKRN